MVLKKVIKVDNLVFEKLSKLKREFNVESPNQVIRKLLEKYEKGLPHEVEGVTPKGLPQEVLKVLEIFKKGDICEAKETEHGRAYIIRCSDGRTAIIPDYYLEEFATRFRNIVIICKGGKSEEGKSES